MNLKLCLASVTIFSTASIGDAVQPSSDSVNSSDDAVMSSGMAVKPIGDSVESSTGNPSRSDGLVKFQWFIPVVNKTELKKHVNNFDDILWPHFEQILFWMQTPEEKIELNETTLRPHGVLLRQDLLVTYEIRCMKATSEAYVFENATREFKTCLKTYLKNVTDDQSAIDNTCRDPSVPIKWMETYKSKLIRCLNAYELKTLSSVQRISEKFLNWNCENSGRCFISLMAGNGNQCIKAHIGTTKACSKDFEHIFPLQDDTIQFDLKVGIRHKLFEKSRCILSALDKCDDPTAKNFYTALFDIIHHESDFVVPIWHILFISFIIFVALSFFCCVFFTSKSTGVRD